MIEQNLIGCILNNNNVLADIADIVTPIDFKNNNARDTYSFCVECWRVDKQVDLVLAASSLPKVNPVYLAESTDSCVYSMAVSYAKDIAEKAKSERLRVSVSGIITDEFLDSDSLIEKISNIISTESGFESDITDADKCVDEFDAMLKRGGVDGFSTGFMFLDNLDIKMIKGDYWVIGASTSVGKTAFAINIFCRLLEDSNAKICMISTEMTRKQLMSRLVAYFTNVAGIKIMRGKANELERKNIARCLAWLKKRVFFISEKTFEVAHIENKVRSLNMKHNIDIVFVDYLQHCRSREYKDKYSVLTNVSSRLQELSKVADICCIALSQLSNDFGKNGGGLEFKGSGDIAGDCDVGIILKKSPSDKTVLQVGIDKNRHGSLGAGNLKYTPNYSKLEECA